MKNILLIGDPHFKTSNHIETEQLEKEILNLLKTNTKIDFVVLLGDILDTHEKINMRPFCRASNFIINISKYKPVYVLIGNHDRLNNNVFMTKEHPFLGLENYKNIKIIDETYQEDNFVFVPYVPNGRFKEALNFINFDYNDSEICIFAHQEFKGCQMKNIVSETGDEWNEDNCPVFSGHIHHYHKPQKNIIYTGTPYQINFGDSANKYVFILEYENKNSWNLNKIELDILKKRIIYMKFSDLGTFKLNKNEVVKIIFEEEYDKKNKKILEDLEESGIKYSFDKKKDLVIDKSSRDFHSILEKKIQNLGEDYSKLWSKIKN